MSLLSPRKPTCMSFTSESASSVSERHLRSAAAAACAAHRHDQRHGAVARLRHSRRFATDSNEFAREMATWSMQMSMKSNSSLRLRVDLSMASIVCSGIRSDERHGHTRSRGKGQERKLMGWVMEITFTRNYFEMTHGNEYGVYTPSLIKQFDC